MQETEIRLLSAEEYLALPDPGYPTELVRGEIVVLNRPNYRHGKTCNRVSTILTLFVDEHALGDVVTNDSGFLTEHDPDTVRGPDVAFFANDRVPPEEDQGSYPPQPPNVIFEVRSPSDRPGRIDARVAECLAAGVNAVVLVDAALVTATIHTRAAAPADLTADERLHLADLPGWNPSVAQLCGVQGSS